MNRTSTESSHTIKRSELLTSYCHATGYFPDEVVGASDEELRDELVSMGYTVEPLLVKPAPAPWNGCTITEETRAMFPGFWA